MRTFIAAMLLLNAVASVPARAEERHLPERQILGLRLDMQRDEAVKRLQEIGRLERTERRGQEIWKVQHASFSHVIVAFSKEGQMRFITAVAREDEKAQRVSYKSVGNVELARDLGDPNIKNFNYEWQLPAEGRGPASIVVARGRDADHLSTLSLKRLGER
jgi:hypothetical protein